MGFRPIYAMPSGGFIRLIFDSNYVLGQTPFCSITGSNPIPLADSNVGLVCTRESDTSLKLTNVGALNAGQDYLVKIRMSTALSTGTSISPVATFQLHYSTSADPSIANEKNN